MNQKDDILRILERNKEYLYSRYPIKSLAVFGSITREEDSDDSDVDVLVEFDDTIGIRFIDLAEEIESLLNRNVHLVSKKAVLPKYFKSLESDLIYI